MESRLAEAFCRSRQMNANSSASGMVVGDDQPGAEVVEEEDQHHDDQQHAAQQVALHDLRGQIDQVAAVVERHDLDVLGQDLRR